MQMILPAAQETSLRMPRRLNSRMASREQRNWPVRFTSRTNCQSASVIWSMRRVLLEAGVVDEDVDRAELLDHLLEHRLHFVLLGDVGLVRVDIRAATSWPPSTTASAASGRET